MTSNSAKERVEIMNLSTALSTSARKFENNKNTAQNIKLTDATENCELNKRIEQITNSTKTEHVYHHSGDKFLRLNANGVKSFNNPILVIGTDGVGTKLKIAQEIGKHDTVGVDLVAMCVNDILCNGAKPLTFLDYYACDQIDLNTAENVIKGIADGSAQSSSCLMGGKTCELPQMYSNSEYDLAGFSMGVLENGASMPRINELVDGDYVIALPSSGVHSNGFSLVHKVMEKAGVTFNDAAPFSGNKKTLGNYIKLTRFDFF